MRAISGGLRFTLEELAPTSWMLELLFYTFNLLNVSWLMRTPCGVSLQEATAGRSGFGSQESVEKSGLVCLFIANLLFEQNRGKTNTGSFAAPVEATQILRCYHPFSLFLGHRLSTIHHASCARTFLNNCEICYITGHLCICNSVKMSLLFKWETKLSFSLTFIIEMTSDLSEFRRFETWSSA